MAAALEKLEHLHRLDEGDRQFVRQSARPSERFAPGVDISHEGARPPARVIVTGWAARLRILPDGRRQIFGFLVPGDMIGLQPHIIIPSAVTAMTVVQTADISALRDAERGQGARPALTEAFTAAADMDEALLLNQIVRLGLQTSAQRLTHLFLELAERLGAAVDQDKCRFPMPLTQESLADALGLSVVHINRTLQQMRQDRLILIQGGQVSMMQLGQLCALSDFAFGRIWEVERPPLAVRVQTVVSAIAGHDALRTASAPLLGDHLQASPLLSEKVGNIDF